MMRSADAVVPTTVSRRIRSWPLPRYAACSALLLLAPYAAAMVAAEPAAVAAPAAELPADVLARIGRVEQGLSPRVVVKDAPNRTRSLSDRMAFHQVPAVSIAVVNNGRLEWARAYGVLDAGGERKVTPATLFQAGSVSKTVSALGALRLVEQARLSLDTPANQQLRTWQIPASTFTEGHPVTLRQLLNHSAGINVHGFYGYAQTQPVPSLLQVLNGTPPANSDPVRVEATPGSAWKYSGGGYSVVQLMMSEAAGQPFPELMQAQVLAPLGMRDSTFALNLPAALQANAATAHRADGTAVPGRWHRYPESAAAGLWTTAADLAKVVIDIEQAQQGRPGAVLSSAMTATMLRREQGEYGLGLYVETLGAGSSFAHSGGTDGFRAQLYGYTHTGQGAVVLTNSDNGAALIEEILVSIAAEYGWPEFQVVEKVALAPGLAADAAVAGSHERVETPAQRGSASWPATRQK